MTDKRTKRDINKELMFNKIMPSYMPEGESYDDSNINTASPAAPVNSVQNQVQTQHVQQNENANEKSVSDTVRYINITEKVLHKKLDGMITMFKCCKCEQCRQSIILNVLNNTKPHYVYQKPSEVDKLIETNNCADIIQPIIRAILDIKANPAHQRK